MVKFFKNLFTYQCGVTPWKPPFYRENDVLTTLWIWMILTMNHCSFRTPYKPPQASSPAFPATWNPKEQVIALIRPNITVFS
jgi:hypothetical protein